MADRPPFARIAVVGTAGSGKTTLFCALAGTDYERALAGSGKVLVGAVPVEDGRIARLQEAEEPRAKITCPTFEICDTPPLFLEGPDRDRNRTVLGKLQEMTGMIVVLKAYDLEDPDAVERELVSIRSELLLNDAEVLQRRLEKIDERLKKPVPTAERQELQTERDVAAGLVESISSGETGALEDVPPEIEKQYRSFALFAGKPLFPVVNIAEKDVGAREGICVRLEHELLGMPEGERAEYMKEYGLEKLVVADLPFRIMKEMGFQLFLTHNPKEVTGWAVPAGSTAPEAAGAIHTDFQRGFINAEVVSWADWEAKGSLHGLRPRVEGKEYVVRDGDIINIRFAV